MEDSGKDTVIEALGPLNSVAHDTHYLLEFIHLQIEHRCFIPMSEGDGRILVYFFAFWMSGQREHIVQRVLWFLTKLCKKFTDYVARKGDGCFGLLYD